MSIWNCFKCMVIGAICMECYKKWIDDLYSVSGEKKV